MSNPRVHHVRKTYYIHQSHAKSKSLSFAEDLVHVSKPCQISYPKAGAKIHLSKTCPLLITKNGENQTLNRRNIGLPLSHCQNRCVNPTAGRVVQRNPSAAAQSPSTGSEPPSVASIIIIIISTSC
jgi:hypothetical protein